MAITGTGMSLAAVGVAGASKAAVVLGAAFAAAGFEAVRTIGYVTVTDEPV